MRFLANDYLLLLRILQDSWWVKWLLAIWAVASTYDLLLSQFVPDQWAKKAPKAWEAAVLAGDLLPWWGWLLILAAIIVAASLEYALRVARGMPSGPAVPSAGQKELRERADANRRALRGTGQTHTPQQSGSTMRVTPQMVRVKRFSEEYVKGVDALEREFERAEKSLSRREELHAKAHLNYGYDPHSEDTRKAAILFLAHLRGEGVEIRNAAANVVNETVNGWIEEAHEWMAAVLDGLSLIDEADAELFRVLDTVGHARIQFFVKVIDPERVDKFLHEYRMHDLRLSRLWDLLQKYQGVTFRRG